MKNSLSRNEWLLITAPLIGFGIFAAFYARWKATAPATLSSSPVPLIALVSCRNGESVVALGEETDSLNVQQPGTPWHFLRWDAKTGKLVSHITEGRRFLNWSVSSDGELVAFYLPGAFNRTIKKYKGGRIIVRRTDGVELSSWALPPVSGYFSQLNFSPDARELLVLNESLGRYEVATGKLLGVLTADQVFSKDSRFKSAFFSPDGRSLSVLESELYSSPLPPPDPKQASTSSGSVIAGGHLAILSYPNLKIRGRPRGDLYASCAWESDNQLWGIATLKAGYRIQKLVRSHITVHPEKSKFDVLELPDKNAAMNEQSLSVNGRTGQVIFAGQASMTVWGRDGKIENTFTFGESTAPKGGRFPPGVGSPPSMSRDGRSVFRINGNDIERYDLSRFLPDS